MVNVSEKCYKLHRRHLWVQYITFLKPRMFSLRYAGGRLLKLNVQRSTFNVQRSTFNVQRSTNVQPSTPIDRFQAGNDRFPVVLGTRQSPPGSAEYSP
jgi:hypothetical protein